MAMIKRYWDIICGIIAGAIIALAAKFQLEIVQKCYSIIILFIVCIGFFRIIKQEVGKKINERKHNVIDAIVDAQKPIKAVMLAESPTKVGEGLGKKLIIISRGSKIIMEKLKVFFSKFKGYMLTIALALLGVIEMCGGFINELCGGVLVVNGIEILPIVTLGCVVVVGLASNTFTKEQAEKVKALFSKSSTNEIVQVEIKKTIKEKSAQLAQFNKTLTVQQHELSNLQSELESLNNTLAAKKEMNLMAVPLATEDDVRVAAEAVEACLKKIADKQAEIAETQTVIETTTTMIAALRTQLNA